MAKGAVSLWMVPFLGLLSMFQASLTGLVTIYGVKPDLVLLLVLVWALFFGNSPALVWAFVGGIWLDIFSGGPMGASSISLMVASLVGGLGYRSLSRFNVLVPVFIVIVGSLTFSLVYLGILEFLNGVGLFPGSLDFFAAVESIVIPAMLYNTTLMLIIAPFLNRRPRDPDSILS